ncbi:hypothetical protein [Granulicella sibirica]|uniref:Uncharacterized protein n=1 Tax=Granulicella sibirica TaxID=2479048 RepID=A0A4Q0T466_9BACT|nr:hypothetical protein [Granulicella sibirica]RXH56828.1 hypothetical protein GRAN_0138 [Granulicella sibirica]
MTTLRGLVFLIAVSIAGSSDRRGVAQQTLSSPIGSSSASVRLEPHESKVKFRLGDPIALDLVLAAESGGYQTFLKSSRIDFPKVNVTPAAGWLQVQVQSLESPEAPGQDPIRIPVLLNRSIVFQQPGYYQITITMNRPDPSSTGVRTPEPKACCRETTNAVGIEILQRNDHEESELVAQLSSLLEQKPDTFPSDDFTKQQKPLLDELQDIAKNPLAANPQRMMKLVDTMRAAEDAEVGRIKKQKESRRQTAIRLSYLQGDDAVRAKVRWILADPEDGEDDTGLLMLGGLAHSRNLQLQLQLLQTAWSDIGHVPTETLQSALQRTKASLNHVPFVLYYSDGVPRNFLPHPEVAAERQRELEELLPSLQQRASPNREQTMAFLIFGINPRDGLRLRTEIEKVFGGMSPAVQNSLLKTNWPGVCNREFPVPSEPLKSSCGFTEPTGSKIPARTPVER